MGLSASPAGSWRLPGRSDPDLLGQSVVRHLKVRQRLRFSGYPAQRPEGPAKCGMPAATVKINPGIRFGRSSPCLRVGLVAMKVRAVNVGSRFNGAIMNQTELIAVVAERAGLTKADAGKAVEALVGTITDTLKAGDEIRIAGFGTFGISERGERQGRNPQTGAPIKIAASKAARFTAGKGVKDALNGG